MINLRFFLRFFVNRAPGQLLIVDAVVLLNFGVHSSLIFEHNIVALHFSRIG